MTWQIPQPADLSDRASALYEQVFIGCDARSPNSMFTVSARALGSVGFDVYLYQARIAQELMVDTAVDWLPRHGSIWGVPQEQPSPAAGTLTFQAPADFTIPAGEILSCAAGLNVQTTATVTSVGAGNLNAPVVALTAGSAGNLPAGTPFTMVSPLTGLTSQEAVVAADANGDGLTGGLDLESTGSWRGRIQSRIRNPPQGGASPDYVQWTQSVLPGALVNVQNNWTGPGTVGVIVAAPGPAAASPTEIAEIQAYINSVRPVTATVTVEAATLVEVNFDYNLDPNTIANQTNSAAALSLWMSQDAAPGATLFMSRADNAVSSAGGAYSLDRVSPTTDLLFLPTECPVLGTATWGTLT